MTAERAPGRANLALARLRSWLWWARTLSHAESVFRLCPRPCVLERPFFGYRLAADVSRSDMQKLLYLEGPRFIAERRLLRPLVRPGMAVADVGANIGYYALMFRNWVGERGLVTCFEPEPENLEELRRNVDRNHLSNVAVMPMALGANDESLSLARSINASITAAGTERVTVPVRRLDSVGIERLDLIKIDVEGYEAFVLAGATATLQRFRPDLFVEIHSFLMGDAECGTLLRQLRDYDSRLRFYRLRRPPGSFTRLLSRYSGAFRIQRIHGNEEFLRAAPELRETFWCLCRGSRTPGRPLT